MAPTLHPEKGQKRKRMDDDAIGGCKSQTGLTGGESHITPTPHSRKVSIQKPFALSPRLFFKGL
ncbi:hypothetical protein E2C01_001563 [Portunus trituberculatus]|uniref:Uncharacterized protein n=1 Tax=Portunus trituberculatus TaxID=210409 RepID=A0A5B7CJQ9_PORTR|nr:hypothetical protein [Portunus trituberculatus]